MVSLSLLMMMMMYAVVAMVDDDDECMLLLIIFVQFNTRLLDSSLDPSFCSISSSSFPAAFCRSFLFITLILDAFLQVIYTNSA
jgi:hypothetical protein